jgi:predicted phage tail protein
MRITVVLHGKLKQFKQSITLEVDSFHQVISYLLRAFPAMKSILKTGCYHVTYANELKHDLISNDSDFKQLIPSDATEVHIVPLEGIGAGGKFGAWIKIITGIQMVIVGVVLIATGAGAALGFQFIMGGVGLAVSGFADLQALKNKQNESDKPEDRQSTLFSNATNRVAKGIPLPVGYGRFMCGSNVISQSIRAEDV